MHETDLFLSLAEIAGVFVGFGALISIRSSGATEAHEVTYIRGVVGLALVVVAAALAPVVISSYDIAGRELWVACGLLVLALFWGMRIATNLTPEHRAVVDPLSWAEAARQLLLMALFEIPWHVALILVVLGLLPDQEPALYLTAVVLLLFEGAYFLLVLVFSQGRRRAASGPAALPATGGSGA